MQDLDIYLDGLKYVSLNDEVEIIKEYKKIEKLLKTYEINNFVDIGKIFLDINAKINEIIDILNEKGD